MIALLYIVNHQALYRSLFKIYDWKLPKSLREKKKVLICVTSIFFFILNIF